MNTTVIFTSQSNNTLTRKTGVCPCKDCPARYPACHAHCQAYQAWRSAREAVATAARYDALPATTRAISHNNRLEFNYRRFQR